MAFWHNDTEYDDNNTCPNCGAPTGGSPCTTSWGGAPSCADLMDEDE